MTAISDARHELWSAISALSAASWRVHEWAPDQVVSPCAFIGNPDIERTTIGSPGVSIIVASFPVYCVADGKPEQQSRTLDEMTARVWDAALIAGDSPESSRPTAIDVGGTNLRGVVVQIDSTIRALTLCTPTLEVTAHG